MKDYYKILNVSKSAKQREIKQAYRLLAKQFHPDVNSSKDAASQFIEINEAYVLLTSPRKKAMYDRINARKTHPNYTPNAKYKRQNSRWESKVNRATAKGNKRAKKQGSMPVNQKKNGFFTSIIFELMVELIFGIVRLFV